jgi:glycosyltransferase involved in cell wall biosynthesis
VAHPSSSSGQHTRSNSAPELSVIIPVYASEPGSVDLLRNALRQLKASSFQDFEILIADDASPRGEAVRVVAQEVGAELVRLDRRSGPAAARNAAANNAAGDILIFMDADTSVHPDTLDRFARKFRENPELDAAIGSYDQRPSGPGVVSHFRNLLHSFVHHRWNCRATTFWAGCGAVRKSRFRSLGGFGESRPRPSIEDVEFGLRLRDAGGWIHLDPRIQVTHHKLWTLSSMVRTDLFARAIPWAGILHKYPLPFDLNFRAGDRISSALAALTLLTTVVALIHRGAWWLAPAISLTVIALLNLRLFRFLAKATSWGEAVLCFPLLLIHLATCICGLMWGLALTEHRRDRWLWPAAAMIGLVLLSIQISGGAFEAEFTGHPDEAAHFVSGLMIYDYLANLPRGNPIAWAGQYYLHYPKVAIGHWPPGYHAMEAVWWLFLGPSRITAMLLQWLIGVVALTMLFRLSRSALSLPVAVAIIALTIAAPVFQQNLEQTMADLCCLLWSVLTMQAVVRLVERQNQAAFSRTVLWLLAAALTKGTAVCLVPVPLVALLASRQSIRIPPPRMLMVGVGCLLGAAALYLSMGDVRSWGGLSLDVPWPGAWIGHLAGWGFLALAVLGFRRQPLALAAGAVIVCTLGVSFVVRALQEERHWIITLPAILVLGGFAISRTRRPWLAVSLVLSAVALFPFARYRQSQSGFGNLLPQLARPSRMLVSSGGFGEGPWIAVASLAEQRPASFVVRASKVLAESGWNGEGYRLLTPSRDAVSRRLDELAMDIVILHTPVNQKPPPHHALLQETISVSAAWRPCGSAHDLLAYCRIRAPQLPRQPLRLSVHGWVFEERIHP